METAEGAGRDVSAPPRLVLGVMAGVQEQYFCEPDYSGGNEEEPQACGVPKAIESCKPVSFSVGGIDTF